jgi:hypothetical protein
VWTQPPQRVDHPLVRFLSLSCSVNCGESASGDDRGCNSRVLSMSENEIMAIVSRQ